MAHTVFIPTPLRHLVDQREAVNIDGATVGAILTNLTTAHPELRAHLFEADGKLRRFVNIYVNDEDIRFLNDEKTALGDGDVVYLVPSVAGGSDTVATVEALPELTHKEVERYSRHLLLPEVGLDGQRRLKAARVLLIGAGGLGSPAALYLAAAGVGTLGLVDFDVVDASNLQRQILHGTPDVGRSKLDSAADRLGAINPEVRVERHETRLTSENALGLFASYDVIVDGTDNFATRYLVNDACVLLGKPNAYGSIFRFEGQASVFATKDGPCYRCLYPEPPPPGLVPSCAEGGVLGVLPGIIGTIQATEAIKLILGVGQPLIGRLMLFDALTMKFRELRARRDPNCPVCGTNPTVTALIDYEQFCAGPQPAAQPADELVEISPAELKAQLESEHPPVLIDVREPHEFQICRIPGSILIPLGQIGSHINELDPSAEIVVHCKGGVRSAKAAKQLQSAGFDRVTNLRGGILAWITDVDPTLPKY